MMATVKVRHRSSSSQRTSINAYPSSRFEPQVRMKWGEILYRRGDYLNARGTIQCPSRKISGLSTR